MYLEENMIILFIKKQEDGYTLLKDSLGFFQYARLNSTGKLYLSGFKARNINERTNKEKPIFNNYS